MRLIPPGSEATRPRSSRGCWRVRTDGVNCHGKEPGIHRYFTADSKRIKGEAVDDVRQGDRRQESRDEADHRTGRFTECRVTRDAGRPSPPASTESCRRPWRARSAHWDEPRHSESGPRIVNPTRFYIHLATEIVTPLKRFESTGAEKARDEAR